MKRRLPKPRMLKRRASRLRGGPRLVVRDFNNRPSERSDPFAKRVPTAAALPMPGLANPAVGRSTPGLLAAHVLRDGEAVLLVTRPSLWFIVLASWRWVATGVAMLAAAAAVGQHYRGGLFAPPFRGVAEAGVAAIAGRLMWASLQWMGRLYVLTDLRLLTVAGVLRSDVLDCPLRRVARTRLCRTTADRAMGIGTVEIIPADPDQRPPSGSTSADRPRCTSRSSPP